MDIKIHRCNYSKHGMIRTQFLVGKNIFSLSMLAFLPRYSPRVPHIGWKFGTYGQENTKLGKAELYKAYKLTTTVKS